MKKRLRFALPFLILPLLDGCLEFEQQTVSFSHDAATDTLRIFQDYQGIFGANDPARLSENEVEQMASVMQGERTFFFSNWITEYNRSRLEEMKATPEGELDENPAYETAIRALADIALANIKVDNVGFYFNANHHLCGAQQITIRNASRVLASLNTVLQFVAREEAANDDKTAEEKRALLQFAENAERTLILNGNRLEARWPSSEEEYRKSKDSRLGRAFLERGGTMQHTGGVLVLAFGEKDAPWTTLTLPFSENDYSENAVAEAKTYGIKELFDPASAANRFFNQRSPGKREIGNGQP